ncbi:MAG: signal peptidase I [Clostridiales bacterium]|nr:signal peptidase I [Clostridiales bacterium]
MNSTVKEILEWIYCIVIALVLAMVFRYFIGTPTIVKMESMKPTLEQNQRLWLNRWGRTTHTLPQRGQIITFEEPAKLEYSATEIEESKSNPVAKYNETNGVEWFIKNFLEIGKRSYIKRVIALPGEHVQIKDGKVYINEQQLDEPYLQSGIVTDLLGNGFDDFTVPENCVFAMGDNRNHSTDCRAFGCIPLEKIESTVAIRIWPLDKWGKVE